MIGRRIIGFTLIELLLVLLLITLLASIVTPIVTNSIQRAKEAVLKENLFVLRKALDDYYSDKGQYPSSLENLVEDRYIRHVPEDPITESTSTWVLIKDDQNSGTGIIDLHSSSDEFARDGTKYETW